MTTIQKGRNDNLQQGWAIRFAVDGDLRFLSHHDMMRLVERVAVRAKLPLRYSEGFNPRPRISLACPRPVGMATRDDLLAIRMTETLETGPLLEQLNSQSPRSLRFLSAQPLGDSLSVQPVCTRVSMPVPPEHLGRLQDRLDQLSGMERWEIRRCKGRDNEAAATRRTIDLRPLVRIELSGSTLALEFIRQGDHWARPAEVLQLLGLDERIDLARMVRTEVRCGQN